MIPNLCLSLPNSRKLRIITCLKLERKVDYGQDYALTTSIVQKACTLAREETFGHINVNAQYIWALQDELRKRGHFIEVLTISCKKALSKLMPNVLVEENCKCKNYWKNQLTRKEEKLNF